MERLPEFIQNHPVLVALAVVLAIAVVVYELRVRRLGYSGVQPQEAIRLMNQGATLFDLRPPEQYAQGHISGAKPLTLDQVEIAGDTLKKYREKLLIVYDETGSHGGDAVRKLHAAGFTKAFNLQGGIAAWRADSLPLVRA